MRVTQPDRRAIESARAYLALVGRGENGGASRRNLSRTLYALLGHARTLLTEIDAMTRPWPWPVDLPQLIAALDDAAHYREDGVTGFCHDCGQLPDGQLCGTHAEDLALAARYRAMAVALED